MRIPRPRLRCDCGAEWSFGQAYIERGPVSAAIAGAGLGGPDRRWAVRSCVPLHPGAI